ncbi:PRD domain-containing protein [Paenibacillus nanensis]|uniref:PRD domain-containing protein n=1 Tax=Paenibacillus nanensis TaxID=393251 RepID=A0A3A1USG6_9BACL|nr:BglG family transcription antiterminator [Paenibacillus nanensis]RIX51489.1 PRD domain-containing protein [Paenibacillus nanensis]
MIVSNRQRHILEVLLQRREATAAEIAEEVQISARTVHRDLQEIKTLLSDYGLSLAAKSGKGIAIEGAEPSIRHFQRLLSSFETAAYSSMERKTLIQCMLLEAHEPIKLFALAYEVHAAVPTISRDLDELAPTIEKFGLELIRRRGYGVEIAGRESDKRSLIEWLAQQYLDESDLFGPDPEAEHAWPVTRKLLQLAGKEHFLEVERIVWGLEEKAPSRLSENAYTRLLLKLSIAIARMQSGHTLDSKNRPEREQQPSRQPFLEPFLKAFPLEWPEAERASAGALLTGANKEARMNQDLLLHQNGAAASDTARRLIQSVGKLMHMPFHEDRSLLEGLIRHMAPSLERIRNSETIRNPLLPQIKKDFAKLYEVIRCAVDETMEGMEVPDEEIGYLAMHFGASIERLNLSRRVKAMMVCTSGIGSSKLLSVRIAKRFPQIEFIGHYSWYEASRVPEERYDLIISTVDLPIDGGRYIKISPLLTAEETEKLRSYLGQMPVEKEELSESEKPSTSGSWERMKLVSAYTSAVVSVLEPFSIQNLPVKQENGPAHAKLENIVAAMLETLPFSEQQSAVIRHQLLEREKHGSQAIGGTKLALFHTRSEHIERPELKLFRLEGPLWLGADGEAEVRQILLMLAPMQVSRVMLEVLSDISAMLLQEDFIELLEHADIEEIKPYISQELDALLHNKWRG